MNKLEFLKLFDIYGGLFTLSRREICEMYLNFDLTVTEIAEQKNISRQGVSDCIKKCKEELSALEENLKFSQKLTEISKWAKEFKCENPDADLSRLYSIIEKD